MMKAGRDLIEYASDCRRKKGQVENMFAVAGEDGKKELGAATALMEVVADYKGVLQGLEEGKRLGEEEMGEGRCLEVEYFLLRAGIVSCSFCLVFSCLGCVGVC